MTYSNRPVSSAFQHRSEFDKSSDAISCRKVNPFLNNMPGAWSAPYRYAKPTPTPAPPPTPLNEESPICKWGATWGDNTVSVCKPPFKFDPVLSCPMSRPLVPERRIDPGMWFYNNIGRKYKENKQGFFLNVIVILLIIILILQFISKKNN
jgi:hypothetical protein